MTHRRKLALPATWAGAGEVSEQGWGVGGSSRGSEFVCGLEWV